MNMLHRVALAAAMVLASPSALAHDRGGRAIIAVRTAEPPTIDGRIGSDWDDAYLVSGLIQDEPDNGEPATERSEILVLYDDRALYVAARLHDHHPVTSRIGRRDDALESDWFTLSIDPHHDHRTGARFAVNPAGVQRDWILYDESQADVDWDAVWRSAVRSAADGWTVEMAIPYSQLRFPDLADHTWGIGVERYLSRRNETARLIHVDRNDPGMISLFSHLEGISGIRPARNLEVIPYVVGRTMSLAATDPRDPLSQDSEIEGDAGATIKYGLTSNLTLSGTINPDFGQVEVDPAVVNLTAFETFYPERRPFFLEGVNLFQYKIGSLFHSRRIGRSPQGGVGPADYSFRPRQTTILGAAKVTGKTAGGWSVGILDAVTEEERGRFIRDGEAGSVAVEPLTNYFAARVRKDIGSSSDIGGLFTSVIRDNPAELDPMLRETASVGGLDGTIWFGDRDYILEWAATASHVTGTPEAIARTQDSSVHYYGRPDADNVEFDSSRTSLDGWAGKLRFVKTSGEWRAIVHLEGYSPGFEPNDLGFLARADLGKGTFYLIRRELDPARVRSWVLAGRYDQQRNFDGDLLLSTSSIRGTLTFLNYWSIEGLVGYGQETLNDRATRGGPLTRDPGAHEIAAWISSDSRRAAAFSGTVQWAKDEEEGFRRHYGLDLTFRPSTSLAASLEPSFTRQRSHAQYIRTINDEGATSTYGARYVFGQIDRNTFQLGTRLEWAYSPTLSLELYLQPFVASGEYSAISELARPASLDYDVYGIDRGTIDYDPGSSTYTIDPDAGGDAAPFTIRNPDFNLQSIRGNLVVRWEYRPGSTIYVAWTRNGSEVDGFGDFDFNRDTSGIFSLDSDDVFLVKIAYWLGL